MKTLFVLLLMLGAAPLAATAAAQDALEEAKAHYAAAAYEEALSTLTRVDVAQANKVELEQYRAFCFIALGKLPEAERAVASLVATDPRYVPSPTVASPRVLQLVSEMRRKELPGVARKLFDDGRAAFKDKQFTKAQRSFELLLQLLDDPALKGRPENDDLRVLAEGFVALTDASAAPEPKPTASGGNAPANSNGASGNTALGNAALGNAAQGSTAPGNTALGNAPSGSGASSATGRAVRTTGATLIEPPVALQQVLPEWTPPDNIAASRDYVGSVKVIIGIDGRVKAASIEKATHPVYDARLLQVARQWVYKPATRNGEPVESEKIISVQLRRRD